MLHVLGEWLGVPLEGLEKEVTEPSVIIDLIEGVLEKEVNNLPRPSVEVQAKKEISAFEAMRTAPRISEADVRRYMEIVENLRVFFFTFELGFTR